MVIQTCVGCGGGGGGGGGVLPIEQSANKMCVSSRQILLALSPFMMKRILNNDISDEFVKSK